MKKEIHEATLFGAHAVAQTVRQVLAVEEYLPQAPVPDGYREKIADLESRMMTLIAKTIADLEEN